jgi:hypothetical protein
MNAWESKIKNAEIWGKHRLFLEEMACKKLFLVVFCLNVDIILKD